MGPPFRTAPPFRVVPVRRLRGAVVESRNDDLVVEEPLEIRVAGDTFAITMRTSGNDRELVLGLLFAEGLIVSTEDVASIAHCGRTGDEGRFNTVDVVPAPGRSIDVDALGAARRGTLTTASCGVCGRRSIDDLLARCKPLAPVIVPRAALTRAVDALGRTQTLFSRTGGCHGAALTRFDGTHVATFEDVGRHNAVDKVVGSQLLGRTLPLSAHVLAVSGRSSFEIVQKAVAAGIPAVASISAASSLAADLARRAGLVLAGFVRGEGMTVYAGDVADE